MAEGDTENNNAFLIVFVCFSFNANPKHNVIWYCCNLCIFVDVGFGTGVTMKARL